MLNFYFNINQTEYKKNQTKNDYNVSQYPEKIQIVGTFTIEINNKVFFKEPYFPILEFIRILEQWDKTSNMFYNGIETEDNPLISFVASEKGWKIKSSWQLFECLDFFTIEELLESIDNLIKSVKKQLN